MRSSSRGILRRKQLQERNVEEVREKISSAAAISGKENRAGKGIDPPETCLAEELGVLRRKPLQERNVEEARKKISSATAICGKENRACEGIDPPETCLAEELGVLRRRKEKLRLEQERTEKVLAERSRILDLAMKKVEDRWETQLKIEAELRYIIRLRDLDLSIQIAAPLKSLRDRARESKVESQAKDEERKKEENI